MSLLDMLDFEYDTKIKVTLNDGTLMIGQYTDYTYADDNENDIASMNLYVSDDELDYCLYENEIKSIELIE